jgi:hypothetical protein
MKFGNPVALVTVLALITIFGVTAWEETDKRKVAENAERQEQEKA